MNTAQAYIGQLAGVVAFVSFIPYLLSILKGKTKPSRAGYAIWSVVEVVWIASYISSGATTTKWTGLVFAATAILIFLLSIKFGMGGYGTFDVFCLVMAATAVYIWITTSSPTVAVYMSTAAALIGFFPIIKKSYLSPETESTASWILYLVASILNVLALTTFSLTIVLRPLLTLPLAFLIVVFLLRPKLSSRALKA